MLAAIPTRNPCMEGWPSPSIFDHNYQIVSLSPKEFEVLQVCDSAVATTTVADLLRQCQISLEEVRRLHQRQLILLQLP